VLISRLNQAASNSRGVRLNVTTDRGQWRLLHRHADKIPQFTRSADTGSSAASRSKASSTRASPQKARSGQVEFRQLLRRRAPTPRLRLCLRGRIPRGAPHGSAARRRNGRPAKSACRPDHPQPRLVDQCRRLERVPGDSPAILCAAIRRSSSYTSDSNCRQPGFPPPHRFQDARHVGHRTKHACIPPGVQKARIPREDLRGSSPVCACKIGCSMPLLGRKPQAVNSHENLPSALSLAALTLSLTPSLRGGP